MPSISSLMVWNKSCFLPNHKNQLKFICQIFVWNLKKNFIIFRPTVALIKNNLCLLWNKSSFLPNHKNQIYLSNFCLKFEEKFHYFPSNSGSYEKNNLCLLYAGDVDRAFHLVIASNGLEQTQFLAKSYGKAALHSIQLWKDSHAKDELIHFITTAIERTKWINILFTNFKQFQEFWSNTTLEGFTYLQKTNLFT